MTRIMLKPVVQIKLHVQKNNTMTKLILSEEVRTYIV